MMMADNWGRLDNAMDRQARRADDKVFELIHIRSLGDIKKLLKELDPACAQPTESVVSTDLEVVDDDGHRVKQKFSAAVKDHNKRSLILEGMMVVRRQREVSRLKSEQAKPVIINGKEVKPANVVADSGRFWVDPLIGRLLGAKRDGLLICWNVEGYKYSYDIFEHRLTRAKLTQ